MTRKANTLFFVAGGAFALLAAAAAQLHGLTGAPLASRLVGPFALAAFVLIVVLGVLPWLGTLALKHPIHNTRGFRTDFAAEPAAEAGRFPSRGWRRRQERYGLRRILAAGLYIEPDERR